MTLDEAIKHAEEVMAENLEKTKDRKASDPIAINCFECADEHRQLAEWLKELKAYKEQDSDAISRQAVLDKIKTEIEQAADKQYQIAIGVSDLNERYAHIQMENAYRHSLRVIDKYKAESEKE